MTVNDVMTKQVAWCTPDTDLAAVAALFWDHDCGTLPVLNEDGELKGILTDRHVCIAVGTRNCAPSALTAGDVMQQGVVTCRPSDHVRAAVHLMRQANVRRLPVISEHGVLEGIVSIHDILMNVQKEHGKAEAISYAEMVHSLQALVSRLDRPASQSVAA